MSPPQDRLAAAEVRACDAFRSVTRAAHEVLEELEEVTDVNGVPNTELSDEDSMVIAVENALGEHQKLASG